MVGESIPSWSCARRDGGADILGTVRFHAVDIDDAADYARWYESVHASEAHEWPDEPGWLAPEILAIARNRSELDAVLETADDESGRAIGALMLGFPKLENLEVADAFLLAVRPEHRHRGVGRALVERAEELARAGGRSRIVANTNDPVERAESSRNRRFAANAGASPALRSVRRQLRLPLDPAKIERLEADCLPHAAGYTLVNWLGHCPEAFRSGRCRLAMSISADAPKGDLRLEDEVWDCSRLDAFDSMIEAMDRVSFSAGAVDEATGELVAFTQVAIPRTRPELAQQFDTVVLPEHRGHRLGTLVKLANLRVIAESSPATTRIVTWNAESNEPMIDVNEAMGFEILSIGTIWQKEL